MGGSARLFFGVFPPPELVSALPELSGEPGFRAVPPENRHVTLYFLGNLPREEAIKLREECRRIPLKTLAFSAWLTTPGVFPGEKAPRVFWVGVEPLGKWQELHAEVRERFSSWIYEEPSPFVPHLTLGRWKVPPPPKRLKRLLEQFPSQGPFQVPWTVTSLHLVESQLTSQGSVYTLAEELPLLPRAPREIL